MLNLQSRINYALVDYFFNAHDSVPSCLGGAWEHSFRNLSFLLGVNEMSVHDIFMEFIDLKCSENKITRLELSKRLGWHKSAMSKYHNSEMPYGVSLKNAYLMVIAAESNLFEFFVFMDKKLLDQKKRKG